MTGISPADALHRTQLRKTVEQPKGVVAKLVEALSNPFLEADLRALHSVPENA